MSIVENRYRWIWLILGWLMVVAVLVLSLVPLSLAGPEGSDKVSHFVAYGSLMFWFGMLYPRSGTQAWVALGFVVMGVVVEFLQRLTGYRSFDVADMAANAIGVALGWAVVQTPLRRTLLWVEARLVS